MGIVGLREMGKEIVQKLSSFKVKILTLLLLIIVKVNVKGIFINDL